MTAAQLPSPAFTCGVDLVDVLSFGQALDATRGEMTDVCFTDREQLDAAGRVERLAARWAVKEAVAKALGVGLLQGIGFRDVEVTATDGGALTLAFDGEARRLAELRRLDQWAVSVSHECGLAIAMVVAGEGPRPGPTERGKGERNG